MSSPGLDFSHLDKGLDRAFGLSVGSGRARVGVLANLDHAGAELTYHHRLHESVGAYAGARAIYEWRSKRIGASAEAGVELRF